MTIYIFLQHDSNNEFKSDTIERNGFTRTKNRIVNTVMGKILKIRDRK